MDKTDTSTVLQKTFGPRLCTTETDDIARASADFWTLYSGTAAAVLRPRSVHDVAAMVRFCSERNITLVPQGGNTGLAGGAIPDDSGRQVVISLSRLNKIRELDKADYTMTAEAGCILSQLQKAASTIDRLFPLSFGAEGSCQIGGALSTNAGGNNVLRYGNARDLTLGLEVVLPDGTIWNGLRKLRKNNTGYDLKHLFIGAEGTLGIITAAVLKLFPKCQSSQTMILALNDLNVLLDTLELAREKTGEALSAFELIPRRMIDLVSHHVGPVNCVPDSDAKWFVLLELTSSDTEEALSLKAQSFLEAAIDRELITDATVASSLAQRNSMWHFRDSLSEAQKRNGAVVYFDISVPISSIPAFIRRATQELRQLDPEVDINAVGHAGDGNIHFNLLQPRSCEADGFLGNKHKYEEIVYGVVSKMEGSFSAEHGIGLAKKTQMKEFKSPVELNLMKAVQSAISENPLNPGKLLP